MMIWMRAVYRCILVYGTRFEDLRLKEWTRKSSNTSCVVLCGRRCMHSYSLVNIAIWTYRTLPAPGFFAYTQPQQQHPRSFIITIFGC